MSPKTRILVGWILTGLVAFAFIFSAYLKLFGDGLEIQKNASAFGLSIATFRQLGLVELICIVLFIIPRTGVLGTLLVAAYLGGAIVTHIEHQQSFFTPVIIQAVAWIAAVIRFPELSTRILGNKI